MAKKIVSDITDVKTMGEENKGQTRRRQGGEWKQERPFA